MFGSIFGILALLILTRLAAFGESRLVLAVAISIPILALAATNMRAAIFATLVYLIVMGDLRRVLILFGGWANSDPLLLLGIGLSTVFVGSAIVTNSIRLDSPISKWVAVLMAVMILQMFNPKQGGLMVGVAGALFLMAPLLWFWVGKAYATPAFMHNLIWRIVVPFSIAALVFGFYQRFFGYLPYQMEWYHQAGYLGLGNLETGLAPITFFASGTEHGAFLLLGGVSLAAAFLKGQKLALIVVMLFLIGLLLTGSRGPVVKLIGVIAILWAVQGKTKKVWIPRALFAVLIFGVGIAWSLTKVTSMGLDERTQASLQRQSEFFASGGDQERSTVDVHGSLMIGGYRKALTDPLGSGLGATTSAASKYGGQSGASTETDFGDVIVATGIVGGVVYHIVAVFIVLLAVRYWLRTRSVLALAILGIIASQVLSWLGGGLYSITPIVWLCIGSLDNVHNPWTSSVSNSRSWKKDHTSVETSL